jgi:methyl-accepting chemotaxis protein
VTDINVPNLVNVYEMLVKERQTRVLMTQLALSNKVNDQDHVKAIEKQWSEFDDADKVYNTIPFGPGEQETYDLVKKTIDEERAAQKKALDTYAKASNEKSPEFKQFVQIVTSEVNPLGDKVRTNSMKWREYHKDFSKKNGDEGIASARAGATLSMGTLGLGSLIGLIFAVLFSNGLVRTLRAISTAIAESSGQVSSAAGQIASSSEELSQAATEQAASLEETAASIEEMSSMVNKNNENSRNSARATDESLGGTNKGKQAVEQMIRSMAEINESNSQIAEIVKVIREIDSKTKVINDIVFQTKLLSFNASVEAARAGEHGKGFAVVAEEVGNLAQMSGSAAEEISSLLESSIQKVEGIVGQTRTKVENGTQTAQSCGAVLDEIVKSVTSVAKMAGEISTACNEQSQGVQEITKAMNQLDQVTQQNAATSEEAASAAEELSAQAESLNSLVNNLVQAVEGSAGQQAPAAPAPAKAAKQKTEAKVVKLEQRKAKAEKPAPMRQAAGAETAPEYEDPRFREV